MVRWVVGVAILGWAIGMGLVACSTPTSSPPSVTDAGDEAADGPAPLRKCEDDPGCPNKIQAEFLQLWLKSDEGLACDTSTTPARVTEWTDQSIGKHSARPHAGAVGPRCGSTIKGLPVVSFRPTLATTNGTPLLDETLDVDLSWLTTNEYTIFVVERRTLTGIQMGLLTTEYNSFQGADLPSCVDGGAQPGFIELSWDLPFTRILTSTHRCGASITGLHTFEGETAAPLVIRSSLSKKLGRILAIDGAEVKRSSGDTQPVTLQPNPYPQYSGAIGRTHNARYEHRYTGDIAEIIVYMVPLTNSEELAIEQYLYSKWK